MIKYFKLSLKYSFLPLLFLLSSCASLSALKFWENDEFDLDEPRPLQNITEKKEIVSNWSLNFTGDNDLGNFIPSFSSKSIYFADSEGNVKSIDIAL